MTHLKRIENVLYNVSVHTQKPLDKTVVNMFFLPRNQCFTGTLF